MDPGICKRVKWVKVYEQTGNSRITRLSCGISRPTPRQWWKRYQSEGLEGLQSRNRRPDLHPIKKVFAQAEEQILSLCSERRMGARGIKMSFIGMILPISA
jgi:transposase